MIVPRRMNMTSCCESEIEDEDKNENPSASKHLSQSITCFCAELFRMLT